jgi:cytochrome c oxidase assembly protein subunit 15
MTAPDQFRQSPLPHRWAVALACATFPLVWVGGLVTTTDAGMAVPDWPNTYGYNLFLYPWQSWLAAPWDLFVEHGHRMLAATVGLITIGMLTVFMKLERRNWVRGMGFAAVALVVFQGALGGMRVLLDERTLAMLHGMTGPLFFGLTVGLAVITSRTWLLGAVDSASASASGGDECRLSQRHPIERGAGQIRMLATVTAVLAYLQIVLGAVLRHVPVDSQPGAFLLAVRFHLFLAGVLTLHIALLVGLVLLRAPHARPLPRFATMLAGLVLLQLVLGVATWMEKYSVPDWASGWISHPAMVIRAGSWLQTNIITAHVATGSAIFGTTIALMLYSHRLLSGSAAVRQRGKPQLGVAL